MLNTVYRLMIITISIYCQYAFAEPWFTGPLLASSGITIPKGHANLEVYGFDTENVGNFNRHGKLAHTPLSKTYQINPLLSYGLADRVDTQFSLPYIINRANGQRSRHIGDVFALLGFQLLRQDESLSKPNVRLIVQQHFPTGRYQQLNPINQGTDGTGAGSYQTTIGLNIQYLMPLNINHFLRTRLDLTHTFASSVQVQGLNTYGGNLTTKGSIHPGNLTGIDLSGELTLTKHWVAVMEGYYFFRSATKFSGFPGDTIAGKVPVLGHPNADELSLAPAIEYNFNSHVGIIAGVWFAVRGKSAADFVSTTIALNTYW